MRRFFNSISLSLCCYITLQVLAGLSEKKTQGSLILATCKDIAVAVILHSIKLRKQKKVVDTAQVTGVVLQTFYKVSVPFLDAYKKECDQV